MFSEYTSARAPATMNWAVHASSAAATGLVIASAGFGAVYAWRTGSTHGIVLGGLTVLFAIALEIAKPLAVQAFFSAARAWAFGQAFCLAILAVLAIAYSLTAELSLMASIRSDSIATRQAQSRVARDRDAAADARAHDRSRVEAELAAIGSARPVAEIEGLIANLPKRCRVEVTHGSRRTICTRNTSLDPELGRAKRREQLEQALERLAPPRIESHTPKHLEPGVSVPVKDDPAAEALATYLGTIGLNVQPTTLTEWLVLVPVLALEIGSALAVVLVRTVIGAGFAETSAKGASGAEATRREETPAASEETCSVHSSEKPWKPARDRLLEMLAGVNGPLRVGQEGLASSLGVSSARVRQLLKELTATGTVRVRTSSTGTTISLLAAGRA